MAKPRVLRCGAAETRRPFPFLSSWSTFMSKTTFGWAAAILISLSGAAMADVYPITPGPIAPGATPQRLSPRQVFQWLDTNHDGFLTLDEFLAAPWVKNKQRAVQFFQWMDTNKDGLVSLPEFLAAYSRYCGSNGYSVRVAYPWAWTYWRPWRYGWYWQSGWHRRPGVGRGYAAHPRAHALRTHHVVKHSRPRMHAHPGKHPHAGKHVKPPKPRHHGKHQGHGHGHSRSHGKHHR